MVEAWTRVFLGLSVVSTSLVQGCSGDATFVPCGQHFADHVSRRGGTGGLHNIGIGRAASGSIPNWMHSAVGVAALAGFIHWRQGKRPCSTALRGLKDRTKKDFSVKSAMIKKLGKLVLQKEMDMRSQILEDPKLSARLGKSQEEVLADFDRSCDFLKTEVGCTDVVAQICISKLGTGLYMQYLGKPNFPSNDQMTIVMSWLLENLNVNKEDGSLQKVIENYPFVLGRTIPELEESKRFCPEDISFEVAVAEDPALIDKTYNCDGICASQCLACWYNG